ncbi:hypothetical protein MO163_001885 [Listeria monocytogenes]|uniref:hypothetical protein n=1 Tax=Listeria TaxID=1637 RepID=UPI000BDED3F2|nr:MULTISPECIES: hypothetical protein [Listeria]EAC5079605.1 hypothetical protein [Listeria monocytogenes]EAC7675223.1 hypothetical protein [Listeria monocytogenes]EAC7684180.1 hypothetical protein [Listeria monocytogenes]EAC7838758.1 hypothetical protein [Listeria monocytogenes]EAD5878497.1 hypothetical protein [Listeria monocytogenes]
MRKTFKIWLKVTWKSGLCKNISLEVEARTFQEAFKKAEKMLPKNKIRKVKHLQADIIGYIYDPSVRGVEKFGQSKIR